MGRVLATIVAVAALSGVAAAHAASPAGTFDREVYQGLPDFIGSGTCSAFQPAAIQSGLTAVTSGFLGEPFESNGAEYQQVHLSATVSGTVSDIAGHMYRAIGFFRDDTLHNLFVPDLRFDGTGFFIAFGPTGVIAGRATFQVITAPSELDISFTQVGLCRFR